MFLFVIFLSPWRQKVRNDIHTMWIQVNVRNKIHFLIQNMQMHQTAEEGKCNGPIESKGLSLIISAHIMHSFNIFIYVSSRDDRYSADRFHDVCKIRSQRNRIDHTNTIIITQ